MTATTNPTSIQRAAIDGAVHIPVELLKPNAFNRKRYDADKFAQLVDSVRKHGVIQPIIARPIEGAVAGQPLYEIVAGERRWRAAKEAPLQLMPTLVRTMTDLELMELLLTENAEREEMNALDEAECLERMLLRGTRLQGYATVDELAARVGRSRAYVFQRLKLLTLCDVARKALLDGAIDASHALILARIPSAVDQKEATEHIVKGWGGNRMSVRDAQEYVHRNYMLQLGAAIFKIADADLVPEAGSCSTCPKRTGNAPDLFEDVKKADTCTDPACYHAKEEAHRAALKTQAEAAGKTVITGAEAKKAKPQQYGDMKGYLELDKVHSRLGDKPLRKLLGPKHTLEVLVLEDPHTKALVEVVREKDAAAALKERGVLKTASIPTSSSQQRDADAKAKAETAWRSEVARQAVETVGNIERDLSNDDRGALLTEVAVVLWNRLESETTKRVEQLMAWGPIAGNSWDPKHRAREEDRIRNLSAAGFAQYIVACTVAGQMRTNAQMVTGDKPERLLRVAKVLGVDADAVKKRLRDEQLQRVPGKAAAAKRGQPKVTPETALASALKAAKPLKPGKVAVKYRNPATGDTWSGRGLKPLWMVQALKAGGQISDYLVDKPAASAVVLSAAAADPFKGAAP